MLSHAREALTAVLETYTWLPELLGILPLSALLEFIDVDSKLHIVQLAGGVPIWNWPISPSTGRVLLLADKSKYENNLSGVNPCHLDAYGRRLHWMAMDGRHGDYYTVPNSETVRLCLATSSPTTIENEHSNMRAPDARFQQLEVVRVTRPQDWSINPTCRGFCSQMLLYHCGVSSFRYIAVSAFGWLFMISNVVAACLLHYWFGAAFLLCVILSGVCIRWSEGNQPRKLLRNDPSQFDRMIIASENTNSVNWTVFYGDSSLLNSMLNLPLQAKPSAHPRIQHCLGLLLRASILMQWGLALATSALKDWNALIVSVWVVFCIVTQAYLIPPMVGAKVWMRLHAEIEMKRYQVPISSRRALLSALAALNPDSIQRMPWIDPVLKQGPDRDRWEEAVKTALTQMNIATIAGAQEVAAEGHKDSFWKSKRFTWQSDYEGNSQRKEDYWLPFIREGIYIAARLKLRADLFPDRLDQ